MPDSDLQKAPSSFILLFTLRGDMAIYWPWEKETSSTGQSSRWRGGSSSAGTLEIIDCLACIGDGSRGRMGGRRRWLHWRLWWRWRAIIRHDGMAAVWDKWRRWGGDLFLFVASKWFSAEEVLSLKKRPFCLILFGALKTRKPRKNLCKCVVLTSMETITVVLMQSTAMHPMVSLFHSFKTRCLRQRSSSYVTSFTSPVPKTTSPRADVGMILSSRFAAS